MHKKKETNSVFLIIDKSLKKHVCLINDMLNCEEMTDAYYKTMA